MAPRLPALCKYSFACGPSSTTTSDPHRSTRSPSLRHGPLAIFFCAPRKRLLQLSSSQPRRSGARYVQYFAEFAHVRFTGACYSQVTYDLHQVEGPHLLDLRDTLVAALEHYQTGPRTIIVQLCLAISGLALQLPQWGNAVQGMIERFGQNPATVPILLQFLTVLPEELNTNTKIPVTVRIQFYYSTRLSDTGTGSRIQGAGGRVVDR